MPFDDQIHKTTKAYVSSQMAASLTSQHPDDAAVDALAKRMKEKLAKQRAKAYGGWDTDCTQERLSRMLREHVIKGDPIDVANFCAFLHARGEGIASHEDVVWPEPTGIMGDDSEQDVWPGDVEWFAGVYPPARTKLYTEQQVESLLAQQKGQA